MKRLKCTFLVYATLVVHSQCRGVESINFGWSGDDSVIRSSFHSKQQQKVKSNCKHLLTYKRPFDPTPKDYKGRVNIVMKKTERFYQADHAKWKNPRFLFSFCISLHVAEHQLATVIRECYKLFITSWFNLRNTFWVADMVSVVIKFHYSVVNWNLYLYLQWKLRDRNARSREHENSDCVNEKSSQSSYES